MEKTIVIFANSVKHNANCVAGKCITTKDWVRPVGDKEGKELTNNEVKYTNIHGPQNKVKPLQKIIMKFKSKVALINQPENYLIDKKTIWKQNYNLKENDIKNYLDTPNDLWGTSEKVLYQNIKDKKVIIKNSLYLINVDNLNLFKEKYTYEGEEKIKRKAKFKYKEIEYTLPVTDPSFSNLLEDKEEKDFKNKNLCISLGEEFNGYCYKIVATIL